MGTGKRRGILKAQRNAKDQLFCQQSSSFVLINYSHFYFSAQSIFFLPETSPTLKGQLLSLATLSQAANTNRTVSKIIYSDVTFYVGQNVPDSTFPVSLNSPSLFISKCVCKLSSMKKHINSNLSIPSRLLASLPVFLIFAGLQNQPWWVMWIPGFSFQ